MKLSLFTPTNNLQWIDTPYKSIQQQIDLDPSLDIEWLIVPNNNVDVPTHIINQPWVRVVRCSGDLKNIGALKRFACEQATGDVFIEMDHDDELLPGSLKRIENELKDKTNAFLYSDKTVKRHDGKPHVYSNYWGWAHYMWNGEKINESFLPDARSLCQIFYAPDHVRVWTRTSYEKAGGHDRDLFVGDDHDLVIKTYLAGSEFVYIKEPIYTYYIHGTNSWLQNCDKVQKQQHNNTEKYLRSLVKEWCKRSSLPVYNYPSKDFYNAKTNSVGCIVANDTFASIPPGEVIGVMNQCYDKLAPGGWLLIDVPSTDGRGAWCDPTHVSFWNELSFRYYTNKKFAKFIPNYKGRFQQVILKTEMPSEWHQKNNVPYVRSDMCAIKGQRQPGEKLI
jgi:hypothetical protein